jgi:hypothetical protein
VIDDILLQEIQSLREKLKIVIHMLKYYWPDLDEERFQHDIGTCDYQEYIDYITEGKNKEGT